MSWGRWKQPSPPAIELLVRIIHEDRAQQAALLPNAPFVNIPGQEGFAMPRYVKLGQIPRKRHTQFRKPDGGLYSEQVFGTRGFSGIASILYHAHPPTQVADVRFLYELRNETAPFEPLRHRHLKTHGIAPCGDPITGRVPLLVNQDVSLGLCCPSEPMEYYYKNADGDDLLFVHEGTGTLETMFGDLAYGPGDYLVIPRGTIYRLIPATDGG